MAIGEEIKRDGGASAATIEQARQFVTDEELVEMILCCGFNSMTTGLLLALDNEIEYPRPLGGSI